MKKLFIALFVMTGLMSSFNLYAQTTLRNIQPVSFSQVEIQDNFWKPVINRVSIVSFYQLHL